MHLGTVGFSWETDPQNFRAGKDLMLLYSLYFSNEETKAQKCYGTCLRSHSSLVAQEELEFYSVDSNSLSTPHQGACGAIIWTSGPQV